MFIFKCLCDRVFDYISNLLCDVYQLFVYIGGECHFQNDIRKWIYIWFRMSWFLLHYCFDLFDLIDWQSHHNPLTACFVYILLLCECIHQDFSSQLFDLLYFLLYLENIFIICLDMFGCSPFDFLYIWYPEPIIITWLATLK